MTQVFNTDTPPTPAMIAKSLMDRVLVVTYNKDGTLSMVWSRTPIPLFSVMALNVLNKASDLARGR